MTDTTEYGTMHHTYSIDGLPKKDAKRWYMLALLSLFSGLNQAICYAYAPVATRAETLWDGKLYPSGLITVYFMSYIPFSFAGSWIIDKYGLRMGLIIGAAAQCTGAWIRYYATCHVHEDNIDHMRVTLYFGQFLCSLAMPFAVNSPPLLSANWFHSIERANATSISVNANALGIAFVYFVAPFIIEAPGDIASWDLALAVLASWIFLLLVCFFQNHPNDNTSSNVHLTEDYSWTQWITAFHYSGFWITVMVFSIVETTLNVISSLLNTLLRPENFTKHEIGLIGALFIVSALCGSQIICAIVDRTKMAYEDASKFCLVGSAVFLILFKFTMGVPGKTNTFVSLMLAGFFIGPLQPIVLELGVECAAPTSEATVAALQQLCGNVLSAVAVPGLAKIHRLYRSARSGHVDEDYFYACPEWILVLMLTLAWIIFLLGYRSKNK